jgi:uncharacterized lipoprotein YmbA
MNAVRVSRLAGIAALGGALLLSGCLSVPLPKAEADPTRFYVLRTPTATPTGAAGTARVYLQPVEIAAYLRSRPLIVRAGEHEIRYRDFARWGEGLEAGVARVVRESLLGRGAAAEVALGAGRAPADGTGLILGIRVLACEGTADGGVRFRAGWTLQAVAAAGAAGTILGRGDFQSADLRWDGKTEAMLVAQLSAAVDALAGDIAAVLPRGARQ